jgi:DNA-binding Xre family transcriptional regulator
MAKYKQVIIKEVDLKKLAKERRLSLKHLARLAGVSEIHLNRIANNHLIMSEEIWNKLKVWL